MESKPASPVTWITESPVFLFFVIVTTIYAFIEPIQNAINTKNYGIVTFYAGVIISIVILAVVYRGRLGLRRTQLLKRNYFRPFERLNRETAWPRSKEQRELISRIKRSKGKLIILVGDSGVGKSILVESHVIPILKDDNWKTVLFDNYSNFQTQIRNQLQGLWQKFQIKPDGHIDVISIESNNVLIVFDQFEQFLSSYSKNTPKDTSSRDWFQTLLKSIIQVETRRILIVVRKEWYYLNVARKSRQTAKALKI